MKKRLLFGILFVLLALSVSANVMQIDVGVTNIEQYDIETGKFSLDMIFVLNCDYNCSPHDLWIANGAATEIIPLSDTPFEKKFRVRAELLSHPELRNFPFDTQVLPLIAQPKSDEVPLRLIPGRAFISEDAEIKGFYMKPPRVSVTPIEQSPLGDAYDEYVLSISLKRNPLDAITSIFIPLLFFMIVIIVSYVLDVNQAGLRVEIATSILLTVVFFHMFFEESLPDRTYVTFLDILMMFSYFVCLATLLLNIGLVRLVQEKKMKAAHQWYLIGKYAAFIAVPIVYVLLLLFLL